MAAYPTFAHAPTLSSEQTLLDDLQIDRATNGAVRGRAMYTAPKRSFSIVHEGLSATDKGTLVTFYNTNRKLQFDFTWVADSVLYYCYFTAPPKLKVLPGLLWNVTMTFTEA